MSAARVTLVDYGSGNLLSVRRALERCGATVEQTAAAAAVRRAERLVLPGVGAFGDCMAGLSGRKLVEPLLEFAATGRPFLGICVGMQILLEEGEEFGSTPGLGLVPGKVAAIPRSDAAGRPHKTPHIGWTALELPAEGGRNGWAATPLEPLAPGAAVYFLHSYTAEPRDPRDRLADAHYNGRLISAAIARDHIVGTQFHPEKSGPAGLAVVDAFLRV